MEGSVKQMYVALRRIFGQWFVSIMDKTKAVGLKTKAVGLKQTQSAVRIK